MAMKHQREHELVNAVPAKRIQQSPRLVEAEAAKEAARQQISVSNSGTRFLSLPGEIRNSIYAHCLETLAVHLAPLPDHRPPKSSVSPRQFYGLTQVCQQIRKEFGPIRNAHTETWIMLGDVPKYWETFYSSGSPANASGNLIIHVACIENPPEGSRTTNILPFIDLRKVAPNFTFRFGYPSSDTDEDASNLNSLLVDTKQNTAWQQWLDEAVVDIPISFDDPWSLRVDFFVKSEHQMPWMSGAVWVNSDHNDDGGPISKWMVEVGLPQLTFLWVYIVPSEN